MGIPSSRAGTTGRAPVHVHLAKVGADDKAWATASSFCGRAFAVDFFTVDFFAADFLADVVGIIVKVQWPLRVRRALGDFRGEWTMKESSNK